ncbi:MAG: cbb3-type cytochrome c oxidase subunit I [Myxococcota bacterium]|nr:cbb3-type cytochrome c oxidase subunit I [Myxococcota bacterium]
MLGIARGHVRLALVFLAIGGLLGLVVRVQLMQPGMGWVGAAELPGLLTLHALTLVWLALLPLEVGGFLATLNGAGRLSTGLSRIGLAVLALGGVAVYAVIGFQVIQGGLEGLPAPRWLGGIGGEIPPILPEDGPFLLTLALVASGHVLAGAGLVGAGVSAIRVGQRGHGGVAVLTGLGLVGLFGGFVFGLCAHAAGVHGSLARPLWWEIFRLFEAPANVVSVAPLVWLVAVRLAGPSETTGGSRLPARLFGITGLLLVTLALALGIRPDPGYGAVLALHASNLGAVLFAGFGLLYDLWPRLFSRVPRRGLGLAHFAMSLISAVLLLVGMLGLAGATAPRRVASVPELPVHELWHLVASFGAFALGGAVVGGLLLGLLAAPRVAPASD